MTRSLRTRHALPLLLLLLAAIAAACGGGETPPQALDGEDVSEGTGTTAPVAAPKPDVPELAEGEVFRTAAQCGACHAEIYREWKESLHGQAMSDKLFLGLAPENKEECIRCHAPVPIRDVDFDTPIARLDLREDAVSCLTCHQAGENMAGPTEGLSGACRPIYDPDQSNVLKMCFGCHNQHDTGTEWLSGPYGPRAPEPRTRPEKNCLDCHMPEVERAVVVGGSVRMGRRHTCFGGHHFPQIQKAAEIEAEVEPLEGGGFRFRVWVTNVGAGHNIPTDARHRSFDTYVKLWDAEENVILDPLDFSQTEKSRAATYRKYYRNSGRRDTQIPPLARVSGLEEERGYVDVPEATSGRGEAWLVYRLTPEDMLEPESVTQPGTFAYYRARVVKRVEFTFGP